MYAYLDLEKMYEIARYIDLDGKRTVAKKINSFHIWCESLTP